MKVMKVMIERLRNGGSEPEQETMIPTVRVMHGIHVDHNHIPYTAIRLSS